eukprot:gene27186-biopygen3670
MPDLRTVFRRSSANKLSSSIDVVVFNGHYPGIVTPSKLVETYALNTAMMPDWTLKVEDCQIRMRQGYQGSVIVTKTLMRGTRIFSVEPKSSESSVSVGDDSASSLCTEILTSDSSIFSGGSSLTPNPFEQRSFKRLEEAGYIDRVNYRWVIADPPLDTTAELVAAYALNAAMMPDWTFKMEDCQIRMRQGYQDVSLYEQFFKEFGMPDLRSVFRRSVANKVTRTVDDVVFNGHNPGFSNLSQLVGAYALNAAMMPDWHFKVKDCQIRMRQGYQGSVIILRTVAKGTRIFSVEPKAIIMEGGGDALSDDSDSSVSTASPTSEGSSLTPNPFELRSFKRLEEAGYIDR